MQPHAGVNINLCQLVLRVFDIPLKSVHHLSKILRTERIVRRMTETPFSSNLTVGGNFVLDCFQRRSS